MNIQNIVNYGEHIIKNSKFKADGYNKENNIIFEFHGCFWHGCLECHKERNNINNVTNMSYDELYKKTLIKKEHCIKEGYKYISIWECEWNKIKNNKEELIKYVNSIKNLFVL